MPYRLELAPDVRARVNSFDFHLRGAWDSRMNVLIADPLPRRGEGFSIVDVTNEFGDSFLSLVVDDFSFAIQYDVYPWPRGAENPTGYDGIVNVFRLVDQLS